MALLYKKLITPTGDFVLRIENTRKRMRFFVVGKPGSPADANMHATEAAAKADAAANGGEVVEAPVDCVCYKLSSVDSGTGMLSTVESGEMETAIQQDVIDAKVTEKSATSTVDYAP